jgi:hypothetical protein
MKEDPIIKITVDMEDATEKLKGFPGAALAALKASIRTGLSAAGKAVKKYVRERYALPPRYITQAIGKAKLSNLESALTGRREISGRNVPVYLFPHQDVYPEGEQVEIRRGVYANIMHAFSPGHPRAKNVGYVFEREHEGPASEAFRLVKTLAVAQMLNRFTEPQIVQTIDDATARRLIVTDYEPKSSWKPGLRGGVYQPLS